MKRILLIALLLAWAVPVAHGEQRVALVIGNGAYQDSPLRNPPNDARAIAQALRGCGFQVIEKINSDERGMIEAIRTFGQKIRGGGVGLFYYAGHGMQVGGTNYLVPVGTDVKKESDVEFECVDANRVLREMEDAGNALNIIILDACRNNPFARSFRSNDRGLKKMDAPRGSLLAYATAPGDVAADGDGQNGLYTAILLDYMRTPGATVEQVFKNVGRDVQQKTGGSQVPWIALSLTEDFYFVPESPGAVSPSPAPLTPPPAAVQFGHLQVNVNAAHSQVYVNGTYRGAASPGTPLNLSNVGLGQIQVKVTASGYEESTQRHTLKANEWTQAVIELVAVTVAPPAPVRPSARPETRPQPSGQQVGQTQTFSLAGGARIEMVWIAPGSFMMGEEGSSHRVTLSQGFYLGKYEVTQGEWESVMGTQPWAGKNNVQANPNHPAVYISWDDVQAFIGKLNAAAGENIYRLPTEAEWEYACRAGTSTRWPFGEDESQLGDYAWYKDNAWDAGLEYAQPVGQKKPNPWGLYDMHGNVWEWCQDWYGDYSSNAQTDPMGPAASSIRVRRGGAFNYLAQYTRSANRYYDVPSHRYFDVGFRLLRTR